MTDELIAKSYKNLGSELLHPEIKAIVALIVPYVYNMQVNNIKEVASQCEFEKQGFALTISVINNRYKGE